MDKVASLVKTAEVNGVLAALIDSGYVKIASETDFAPISDAISEVLPDNYTMEDILAKTAEVMDEVSAIYDEAGVGSEEDAEMELEENEAGSPAEVLTDGDVKTASEYSEEEILAGMGRLTMAKVAGEIDEEEFLKEAGKMQDMMAAVRKGGTAASTYLKGHATTVKDSVGRNYNTAKGHLGDAAGAVKAQAAKVPGKAKDTSDYLKGGFKGEKLRAALKKPNFNKNKPISKKEVAKGLGQLATSYGLVGAGVGGAAYAGKKLSDKNKKD